MPKGEEAGTGSPVIAADTLNLWRHVRSGCRTLAAALGVHAVNRVRVRQGSQSLDSAGICAKVDLVTASHALLFRMRALVVAQGINPPALLPFDDWPKISQLGKGSCSAAKVRWRIAPWHDSHRIRKPLNFSLTGHGLRW